MLVETLNTNNMKRSEIKPSINIFVEECMLKIYN